MADQPEKPMDVTDLPVPSGSNILTEAQDAAASTSAAPFVELPIYAVRKSKAEKQREYRQRIAASLTPAQAAAARKAKTERERRNRQRKANIALGSDPSESTTAACFRSGPRSNNVRKGTQGQLKNQQRQTSAKPALPSGSNVLTEAQDAAVSTSATPFVEPRIIAVRKSNAQKQREYRQRIAASRTPAQVAAARKSKAERERRNRQRKANMALGSGPSESTTAAYFRSGSRSNYVRIGTQGQLTHQQHQTSAEPAQNADQPVFEVPLFYAENCKSYLYPKKKAAIQVKKEMAAPVYLLSTNQLMTELPVTTANSIFKVSIDEENYHDYKHSNVTAKINNTDVKVENDPSVKQIMVNKPTSPRYIDVGIKIECVEGVNQDVTNQKNTSTESVTSSDMVCRTTSTEVGIHGIKVENDEYDVECGSPTDNDFVTDNLKFKVIQEIVTPEDFTNIEKMCRLKFPTDQAISSVKVEKYGDQDDASENAINTGVKRDVLLGEDYSSEDSAPLAETIHKVELSATGMQRLTKVQNVSAQVKVVAQRELAEDGSLARDNEQSCDASPCQTNSKLMFTHKKRVPCEICDKTVSREDYLEPHMSIHSGINPFSCGVCQKTFTEIKCLVTHMKIHSEIKQFSCQICNKTIKGKCNIDRHMREHAGDERTCKICQKTFSCKYKLTIHMRYHTGEKPYSCHTCNKAYFLKMYLKKHIQVHSH